MKKVLFTIFVLFIVFNINAQNKIKNYEYWFDNDYANKVEMLVGTPIKQLLLSTNISTTGLSNGIHVFNVRFKDEKNQWSSTLSQFFYKLPPSETSSTHMVSYEYWFDNDYENTLSINTSAQSQVVINELIGTQTLTNGIHVFNIRFKDNKNQWSSTLSQFFYKLPPSETSSTHMVSYEYWFDNDYENALSINTSAQSQVVINELIGAQTLTNGIHVFNIRFKDNKNQWSSTLSQFFYKLPPSETSSTHLVSYEYWFDNDYENALSINTSAQSQVVINELIGTQTLTNGIHVFNIRFKDNKNQWSSTLSQFFYKLPPSETNSTHLVSYEYWFDNDYENALSINTSAQSQVVINELIGTQALTNGIHVFNIRFKDNKNLRSSTLSQFFYKMSEQTITDNVITQYRYWIDNEFTNNVYVSLQSPVKQISLIDNLDFTQISKGVHTLHFQFRDSLGLWSSVTTDTIIKLSLPISDFTHTSAVECDSTIINYTDLSVDGDIYLWNFGDGILDTIANPTHTYYLPGTYSVSLTITDTMTLVSSTKQMSILITGNTSHSFSVTSCESYTSPSGNYFYATSGTYNDTIQNQWGCDSVLTMDVTINYSTTFTDVVTACDSYTWMDGVLYTASNNTAVFTLPNSQACDSIVTLNLTINQTPGTSVLQDGITLTAIANAPGITYQWLDCNNNMELLPGETGQSFTATVNGRYALEISENECIGVSDCYTVNSVGILANSYKSEMLLYPNPTNGKLYLEMGQMYPETVVKIYDVYGKLVNQFVFKNENKLELYINEVNGIYLMDVQSGNQKALIKVIKN